MLFLLIPLGVLILALLIWQFANLDTAKVPDRDGVSRSSRRDRVLGPDDDPDFLRSLDERPPKDE